MRESQNVWHFKREENIHLDGNPEEVHLLEVLPRPSSSACGKLHRSFHSFGSVCKWP